MKTQPATFFENHFLMLVVYLVDLFTEELYKDLNYMFRLILLFSEQSIIY